MKKESDAGRGSVLVTGYDPGRLEAIEIYCREKGVDVNDALKVTLDVLYARHVPPSVQKFLKLTGEAPALKKDSGKGASAGKGVG